MERFAVGRPENGPQSAARWSDRFWWAALAFVPSSLLLGVTTYISTDIARSIHLGIPLFLYLLTFILVFARRPPVSHATDGAPTAVARRADFIGWYWGLAGAPKGLLCSTSSRSS